MKIGINVLISMACPWPDASTIVMTIVRVKSIVSPISKSKLVTVRVRGVETESTEMAVCRTNFVLDNHGSILMIL